MNPEPLVTIISPTYNHAQYIEECILSVLNQTFTAWEMIVVNDGSTDNTEEVVKKYCEKDSRIKLISQDNIGIFRLSESYNKALGIAKGKYVSILEGDDLWAPDKLQRQVDVMEQNPEVVLCWGKANAFMSDLSEAIIVSENLKDSRRIYFENFPIGSILNILYVENCIAALTITIRKEVLQSIGGFIQKFGLPLIDISTLFELAKQGRFYYDNAVLGEWRVYSDQTTKTYPVSILKGRYQLALSDFDSLTDDIRKNIFITRKQIVNHFEKLIPVAYARSGRYKLIRKDFKSAREDYVKAIFYKNFSNPVWRIRAIIGYVFSLFGKDVEGLSKLLGKQTYKK